MKQATILDQIMRMQRSILKTIYEIDAKHGNIVIPWMREQCIAMPPTRGFRAALAPGNTLIAEVKKASPSKGIIRHNFDPVAIAEAYHAGGATCLSVLTERMHFQGDIKYLETIREAVPLPLLRKDFLFDPYQVYEARQWGADAILLIVACVPEVEQLRELRELAAELGMDTLVEVHDREELAVALASGADLIGVNNRNLHTFDVHLETAESLLPLLPAGVLGVAESGIFTSDDAARMYRAGASALLVGESLMRADDIVKATERLRGGYPMMMA